MPPPRLQSTERKRVGVTSSPVSTRRFRHVDLGLAAKTAGDLVAKIAKVGGAGAEIVVVGGFVV